ncbi:hypothetical protein CMI47_14710 [Candidatus Pacearchaeota archaeon]|jgi:hypothetical protein|nr:hypothetical protein [Candidatus Pacearchaeota archaeon]|tara:strand:+ start:2246 stop:3766 length:1521 start_codon:yes stop_codon:yes gene_type:complete
MNPTFVWWKGKVEDRTDPLQLGRCKVRILGYHTDDVSEIPTEDLPFAYPAMPINSRPSDSPVGPVEGTWVMGFFADGENAQQPIMTHIIDAGYKTSDDPTDIPESPKWGKSEIPVGEVNTNRLARGETADTYVSNYESVGTVPIAGAMNTGWQDPELGYDAEYPYNKVEESQSGHVHEVDDTKGNERIAVAHKSGTVNVMKADGDRVAKVVGHDYTITVKDNRIYAKGNVNITADGDVNIKSNKIVRLEGLQVRIKGDLGILLQSPTGVFVSAPFLSTDPKLGGAIMHGGTGSPFVAPAGIPPDAIMVDLPSPVASGIDDADSADDDTDADDSLVVKGANPLADLKSTILGGFKAKKIMFLGPAECGTDMLDGLSASLSLPDWLKFLLNLMNNLSKDEETARQSPEYKNMLSEIKDDQERRRIAEESKLSDDEAIEVVDQDGVSHMVTSIEDAIELIEDGKTLTIVEEIVQETVDPEVTTVATEKVIPKITNCCETCGEVTCECTS